MNYGQVVLPICLLLSTIAIINAIQCYQCESHTQKGCFPLDKTLVPLKDCPPESMSCEFITMRSQFKLKIGEEEEPTRRHIRRCSNDDLEGKCFQLERTGTGENTKNTYYKCDIDGCNPAGRITMMSGSGFIAAIVLLITYFS